MLPKSIYAYVWQTSRGLQFRICLLVGLVAPLSMVPLELQRRIVDQALHERAVWLLVLLGAVYLLVVLVQGGLKYLLNLTKGQVLETVSRDLRRRILDRRLTQGTSGALPEGHPVDDGTTVSILAAESEDIGGFASESFSVPLLQVTTIMWVAGYLLWVEPLIAVLAILIYAPQFVLVPQVQKTVNRLTRRKTRTVRLLGREAVGMTGMNAPAMVKLRHRVDILIRHIFDLRMRSYRYKFFLTFLGNFLDALGPIIVLVAGGYMVIQGRTEISTLVVFISGFQKLSDPWDQLVTYYRTISNTRVAYALVSESLD